MDSNSLLTSLMQLAERSKRNLRAAPGQIADQVSNFVPDFKATSAAVPAAIKNSTGKTDEEVLKRAIEETAGNAIPGVPIVHSPTSIIGGNDQEYILKLLADGPR